VLEKYLDYWGPRYRVAPVDVTVDGEWARGVAAWKSEARLLDRPLNVLARRLENSIWQALMPSEEGLYLRWVDEVPDNLVPDTQKAKLRSQAAEADALQTPQATPTVSSFGTATQPAEPPTSGLPYPDEKWLDYEDTSHGFSVKYPKANWAVTLSFENAAGPAHVIRRRLTLLGAQGARINIDVWDNALSLNLQEWWNKYQRPLLSRDCTLPSRPNAQVGGVPAIFTVEPASSYAPARLATVFLLNERAFRAEYWAFDRGSAQAIYRQVLNSFQPSNAPDLGGALLPPTDLELQTAASTATDSCCTYSASGNPYPCGCGAGGGCGNCTWWAWYKRVTVGDPLASHSWGNAHEWDTRAASEGWTVVEGPPQEGAIVVLEAGEQGVDSTYGHVAYVEQKISDTQYRVSDMWYKDGSGSCGCEGVCCRVCTWYQYHTNGSSVHFIYRSGSSPCSAPALVSPSDGFVSPGDTVTFRWDPVDCAGQDGYLLRIGTSSGGSDVVSDHFSPGLQTNVMIGSQWHNQDLYWSVRANASGASWSGSRRLRVEPNQPGDCSGCSSYVTDFSFSPGSPSNATSVNVSVSIETGFPNFRAARVRIRDGDNICELGTFSFSCTWDTRNTPNGDHCIVLEIDDNQGSSWDNPATCHHPYHLDPRPIPPPDPPALLNPFDGASYSEEASITLDWQASANATDYRAHLWGGSGTDQYRTTSTTEWYVGQLDPGTYHWQVRARNESGGADSDEWTFTIAESKPAAPSNLSATALSASRIDLTWNDNSGNETGFRLYREGLLVTTLGAGTESYQDTGLDCGTGYNYYVVAYNDAGTSAHSNTASATTVACPPTADFDAWPLSGEAPLEVRFHNISGGSITSCSWEYGDGGTGSSCSDYHYHTYTEAGTYTVQLSVTGPGGSDTRTRYSYISVAAPPPACDPNDDQVALFEYIGYGGSCVTLDIGDYPDPSYLDPVGNDNAESIKVGDDVQAVLYEHNDYGGISAIFTSYDSDLGDDGIGGKVSSVKVQPADTERPVVHWLAPVSDWETYHVSDEVVQLEAGATDNVAVARVRFSWWDKVNLERIEIANDYTPPYRASLDCTTLNFEGNEIEAEAYDTAGNASSWKHIWLYRDPPEPDLHSYTRSGYPYPVVPSSSSGTHEVDTLHAGQTTYFDWYFTNSGNATASGDFHVELWVGDERYVRYPYSDYGAGWIGGFDDWAQVIPAPGWHTIRLVTDADGAITESDEGNNIWERDFYWTASAPYGDDMESGTNEWTATGLWHQVDGYSPYPENHSSSNSWWYGQDATGDYDTGAANSGSLTSRQIYIPESGHYLRFWYWYETETQGSDWDQRWVQIAVDGGAFNDVLQLRDDPKRWWLQSPAIDLSGYAGHTIQIRFHFETLDSEYNGYRGWYIDDFEISTTPPPSCADSHEPNDTPTEATSIAYGQSLEADTCPGGDYDFYAFSGAAGDKVVVDIDAQVDGSWLDP
jgi:PKD repeat protein/surface antigen